jgi:hypothetical protein
MGPDKKRHFKPAAGVKFFSFNSGYHIGSVWRMFINGGNGK